MKVVIAKNRGPAFPEIGWRMYVSQGAGYVPRYVASANDFEMIRQACWAFLERA